MSQLTVPGTRGTAVVPGDKCTGGAVREGVAAVAFLPELNTGEREALGGAGARAQILGHR